MDSGAKWAGCALLGMYMTLCVGSVVPIYLTNVRCSVKEIPLSCDDGMVMGYICYPIIIILLIGNNYVLLDRTDFLVDFVIMVLNVIVVLIGTLPSLIYKNGGYKYCNYIYFSITCVYGAGMILVICQMGKNKIHIMSIIETTHIREP